MTVRSSKFRRELRHAQQIVKVNNFYLFPEYVLGLYEDNQANLIPIALRNVKSIPNLVTRPSSAIGAEADSRSIIRLCIGQRRSVRTCDAHAKITCAPAHVSCHPSIEIMIKLLTCFVSKSHLRYRLSSTA